MNTWLAPYDHSEEFTRLRLKLQNTRKMQELTGVIDAGKSLSIFAAARSYSHVLIVMDSEKKARDFWDEYQFFDPDAVYYPAKDLLFYQSDVQSNTLTRERIRALKAITESDHPTVITTVDALMNQIPSPEEVLEHVITLRCGDETDLTGLRKKLVSLGYMNTSQVAGPGEFAVRGGILDVFSLTEDTPVRIEFWGDEVDSIRLFDPLTQKSSDTIEETVIYPAIEFIMTEERVNKGIAAMEDDVLPLYETYRKEMKTEEAHRLKRSLEELKSSLLAGDYSEAEARFVYFTDETYSLLDYIPANGLIILDEPAHLVERAHNLEKEFSESMLRRQEQGYCFPKQKHMLFASDSILARCMNHSGILLPALSGNCGGLKSDDRFYLHMTSVTSYNSSLDSLRHELEGYLKRKYKIFLVGTSRTRGTRLAKDLMDYGFNAFFSEDPAAEVLPGQILVCVGRIRRGFEFPEAATVFIAESDIFGSAHKKRTRKRKKEGESIRNFGELNVGDYVVHENYGLGIYQGLEQIEVDHVMKDYLKISYAKGSALYILATQLDQISKYGSVGDKKPKLSVLGTADWSKTKARVKKAVGVVARDLVDLYALRQNTKGYVCGPDTVWQQEFEESFPYEETQSQLTAVEDIKADMESSKIMDRLICGDVGYGKTEIAMRAAFKAVQESKQVVYLVPTTILAQQHFNNFKERMKDYPVNIGMLSRFRTPAQNSETVRMLKDGRLDIVIGTHRLLSKDVGYKDLGLLIIDEEQRFGVAHKEKIKKLKKNVDVLSLSATPIPRTLHMSLVGIRDMSLLEDAPMERTPIQTFVFEQNEEMVREAIQREMDRGGQVYYVINRVREIADITAKIEALCPDANVAYAHGKMSKDRLEEIMTDFINRDIDVLVATTIIEIGLDISNVNTIIIHDADQLGLSQLYQLRGRVGRSNRTAFAFLMYRRNKMLKEVAEKRLSAIREFTDLGSGFKIAMRDLEIRGAGNLLGEAQSGHMEAVGYELYCKMLNAAVAREKGITDISDDFDTTVDIAIDAYIPSDYIPDTEAKLDMYKRISVISSDEEEQDMIDELIDRFGDPGKPVMNLLLVARLRSEAHKAYITELKQKDGLVTIKFLPMARLNPAGIPSIVEAHAPYLTFIANPKAPAFSLDYKKNNNFKEYELPIYLKGLCRELQELTIPKESDVPYAVTEDDTTDENP
jgi:transcription-repair coupling factor (superfamily II helicase)